MRLDREISEFTRAHVFLTCAHSHARAQRTVTLRRVVSFAGDSDLTTLYCIPDPFRDKKRQITVSSSLIAGQHQVIKGLDFMRICLIPLKTVMRNPSVNFAHVCERLKEASVHQPELVCLPECALTGYVCDESDLAFFAEPHRSNTFIRMKQLAIQFHTAICYGYLEATPKGVYNTAVLIDAAGRIALTHRKISEKPPFLQGTVVTSCQLQSKQVAILICADLFERSATSKLCPALDLLLVPMARCFDGRSPDPERWEREERSVYLEAVRTIGVTTVICNCLEEPADESYFGGAIVVSSGGTLLAESPHGSDQLLLWDI